MFDSSDESGATTNGSSGICSGVGVGGAGATAGVTRTGGALVMADGSRTNLARSHLETMVPPK